MEEDREDIRRTREGDEDAYARIVDRHQERIAALLWRFTRDPLAHGTLVHDTFVEAYFSLHTYRGEAPLLHWLSRIATRAGYRFWREQSRQRTRFSEGVENRAAEEVDPAVRAGATEAATLLHEMLAALSPKDRLVLTLTYFEDLDAPQIAERMDWSAAATRMRISRARRRLRKIAEARGLEGDG